MTGRGERERSDSEQAAFANRVELSSIFIGPKQQNEIPPRNCLFSSPDVIVSQDQLKSRSLAACLACECTIHSSAGSLSFSQDPKCLFLSSGGQHCFLIPCRNTAGLQQSLFFQKQKKMRIITYTYFSLVTKEGWSPEVGPGPRD